MSAIFCKCSHCGQEFIAGVVGSTPWPAHVCPDGTTNANVDFDYDPLNPKDDDDDG